MNSEEENRARDRARKLRYKHPISRDLNLETIRSELWEMEETCTDVKWFTENEENLVAAMDGDEDEAYEFKMAFSDLAAELAQFSEDLENEYVPDCFDEFFPAIGADYAGGFLGFDAYENDYYGLAPYEYEWAKEEAGKRIQRMTKKELLEAAGACLKVVMSYLAVRYRYDCLEASLKILQGKNMQILKLFRQIEEQYEKAEIESSHFQYQYHGEVYKLNRMLDEVPNEYWIQ